ncbi:TIGR00282 family metallophosphoesterase [uncultured Secundilactobacillus sp.]|uniref:TIGR00282 family metallophosphoesterase n=1 Tax=uncultured Secundilactobacillus sp. TaxID=2813935 RepID=UPI00258FB383|nr:TIGR00282 family metallophosphoesterase [uncultured Secundilactobacillus sp.]
MRILFIGDVVGDQGMDMIQTFLPRLKRDLKPQATIVNGENATPVGRGISEAIYKTLLSSGADVVTMGNHVWDNREIFDFIDSTKKLVRPANFPGRDVPGRGFTMLQVNQKKLGVINLQGRVFLPPLDDPFQVADRIVDELRQQTDMIFVDMHAEVTSEKRAMALYLSGRVTAVVGTHTHVQTNDGQILTGGTAFMTDAGMTGPDDGILGMKPEAVIGRFLDQRPARYEVATGPNKQLSGCIVDISDTTNQATAIKPILINRDHPYLN